MDKAVKDAVDGLTLKRYKVSVLLMGVSHYTVYATNEADAQKKVMDGEGGRAAGQEGPAPFAVRVHDTTIVEKTPTLQNMMNELSMSATQGEATAMPRKPSGLIKVVGG